MSSFTLQQAEDAGPIPAIDAEARREKVLPGRAGYIGFAVVGTIATLATLAKTGSWRSTVFVPLLIGFAAGLATLYGRLRWRFVRGERLVIDPDARVVRFCNFRFRRGLLSRRERECAVPFEHLHGCRRMNTQHSNWLLLMTSEGDVTVGEWLSDFEEWSSLLERLAGKAPLICLLRDRAVQVWLLAMGLAALGMTLPLLLASS